MEQLPFCVEVAGKQGRHAVAKVDLPAGSLVMVESPMVLAARTRWGCSWARGTHVAGSAGQGRLW